MISSMVSVMAVVRVSSASSSWFAVLRAWGCGMVSRLVVRASRNLAQSVAL